MKFCELPVEVQSTGAQALQAIINDELRKVHDLPAEELAGKVNSRFLDIYSKCVPVPERDEPSKNGFEIWDRAMAEGAEKKAISLLGSGHPAQPDESPARGQSSSDLQCSAQCEGSAMKLQEMPAEVQVIAAQTLRMLMDEERNKMVKKPAEELAQEVKSAFEALYSEYFTQSTTGKLVFEIEARFVDSESRTGFTTGATGLQLS